MLRVQNVRGENGGDPERLRTFLVADENKGQGGIKTLMEYRERPLDHSCSGHGNGGGNGRGNENENGNTAQLVRCFTSHTNAMTRLRYVSRTKRRQAPLRCELNAGPDSLRRCETIQPRHLESYINVQ